VCFFHLRQLRLIRRSLTIDAVRMSLTLWCERSSTAAWTTATVFLLDWLLFSLLVCRPSCVLLHDFGLTGQAVLLSSHVWLDHWLTFHSESPSICASWRTTVCMVWRPRTCPSPAYLSLPSQDVHIYDLPADDRMLFVPRTQTVTLGPRAFSSSCEIRTSHYCTSDSRWRLSLFV